jgi:hypothetical protein
MTTGGFPDRSEAAPDSSLVPVGTFSLGLAAGSE